MHDTLSAAYFVVFTMDDVSDDADPVRATGIVGRQVNDDHYLVWLDAEGSPAVGQVVAIEDMTQPYEWGHRPRYAFFGSAEDRDTHVGILRKESAERLKNGPKDEEPVF